MVRMRGLEPPHLAAPDPKSGVYTNFTTSACRLEYYPKSAFLILNFCKLKL